VFPKIKRSKRSSFSTGTPPPCLRRRRAHILLVRGLATRSISQVENINRNLTVRNFNSDGKPGIHQDNPDFLHAQKRNYLLQFNYKNSAIHA
jgi:hypothetical protein